MGRDKRNVADASPTRAARGPLKFQMTLASDPRLLAVVRSTVSELASAWGFGEEECRAITLAVDEALSNIIRHAYKNRCDRKIEVSCRAEESWMEFTFNDSGEPPDPAKICGQALNGVALGGRGTHVIRKTMDEVSYDTVRGTNRLRLKKYLPGVERKAQSAGKPARGAKS
jgi:serine/threonine-protein kinase RsbW